MGLLLFPGYAALRRNGRCCALRKIPESGKDIDQGRDASAERVE